MSKALILLSGGQDSTTCLYWAMAEFGAENVDTVTFDYGQRHHIELECAAKVAEIAGAPNTVLPLNTFAALGGNALTDSGVPVATELDPETGLPNTFVPGRNLIFIAFAAALAYQRRIPQLVTGTAQTDYSGYPDCRQETLWSLERTIRLGMESDIKIFAPLMFKTKAKTVQLAQKLGALEALAYSHSCYNGRQPPCGECSACVLRAKGFAEAGIADPLIERFKEAAT